MKHARKVKIRGQIWKFFVSKKPPYDPFEHEEMLGTSTVYIYAPDGRQGHIILDGNINITPATFKEKILSGEWRKCLND